MKTKRYRLCRSIPTSCIWYREDCYKFDDISKKSVFSICRSEEWTWYRYVSP